MKITVRPYTLADWEALFRIQRECFPPPYPEEQLWSRAQIESHIRLFPEGALCAEVDGEVVGSCTSLIIRFDPAHPHHSWSEVTADGYITTHDPQGDSLYGVDMAVRPDFRGRGVARAMYQARFDLVRRLGLTRFMAGGRMPGYHRYADRLSPEQYAAEVVAGRIVDPVITPQLKAGLRPICVVQNYLPDEESGNNALLLEWRP
ncbi:MAG: GNAT family N-acetyltransferase [Bacillota bacterium]